MFAVALLPVAFTVIPNRITDMTSLSFVVNESGVNSVTAIVAASDSKNAGTSLLPA
jgi:hypothetical protein